MSALLEEVERELACAIFTAIAINADGVWTTSDMSLVGGHEGLIPCPEDPAPELVLGAAGMTSETTCAFSVEGRWYEFQPFKVNCLMAPGLITVTFRGSKPPGTIVMRGEPTVRLHELVSRLRVLHAVPARFSELVSYVHGATAPSLLEYDSLTSARLTLPDRSVTLECRRNTADEARPFSYVVEIDGKAQEMWW